MVCLTYVPVAHKISGFGLFLFCLLLLFIFFALFFIIRGAGGHQWDNTLTLLRWCFFVLFFCFVFEAVEDGEVGGVCHFIQRTKNWFQHRLGRGGGGRGEDLPLNQDSDLQLASLSQVQHYSATRWPLSHTTCCGSVASVVVCVCVCV